MDAAKVQELVQIFVQLLPRGQDKGVKLLVKFF